MTLKGTHIPFIAAALLSLLLAAVSCDDRLDDFKIEGNGTPSNPGQTDTRVQERAKSVMLLYSAGYNSLSSYLQADIKEITESWLPGSSPYENVLLVFSRHTKGNQWNFTDPVEPVLEQIYKGREGDVVRDTLDVPGLAAGTIASDAGTLNLVLRYVRDNFAADSYGMIFSSHATGWLPAGYYSRSLGPKAYLRRPGPGQLMTKTIGQDQTTASHEINVTDFAAAFPAGMKLDYILFDACLMGGIEVAYELKDVCRKVAFSQAEVLADGFDYSTLTTRLLKGSAPDIEGVCRDFYDLYDSKSGAEHSATISLIGTDGLEALAAVCKELFSAHRTAIMALDYNNVQGFFGGSARWFFDLGDMLGKAGISASEKAALDKALDGCVLYKGCTGQFFSAVDYSVHVVDAFCGLSMYLPACGNSYLNGYYRTYAWNKATALVE